MNIRTEQLSEERIAIFFFFLPRAWDGTQSLDFATIYNPGCWVY